MFVFFSLKLFFLIQKSFGDLLQVVIYCILFLVGVVGNVSVVVTICRRGTTRKLHPHRQILVLSLAFADLMICLLCYPSNAIPALIPNLVVPFPICHILITLQGMLHTSSTFSMAFLAFDRYTIVNKPKMAPKISKWLPFMIPFMWFISIIINLPKGFMMFFDSYLAKECSITLAEKPFREISSLYICVTTMFIYVLPCIIVSYCHLKVACSLCGRDFEKFELQQKPRQVIIVAKDHSNVAGNTTHKIVEASSSVKSTENIRPTVNLKCKSKQFKPHLKSNQISFKRGSAFHPSKNINSIIRAHRRLRVKQSLPPSASFLADHKSHSVETRMQLAKFLSALVVIFVVCWLPYACVLIVWPFVLDGRKLHVIIKICLMMGHLHSAISPIAYWIMNRSMLTSVHRLVLSYFHWPTSSEHLLCTVCPRPKCLEQDEAHWGNNSSTNEDALGPFHPRYINQLAFKPQPSMRTSHYFQ